MGANDPRDGAIFDPRSMVGRIYVELHMTLWHTKHTSFGLCCFREEDFFMYFHCYTQNMKALGLLVSETEDVFPTVRLWQLMTPVMGPFLTPGAWLAGFM